ncbi:vacuolar cation/proton exchanger 2-like isoform X2 [Phalaenopsis equestris]|uniref:vacuolar cation/proton exchanger 2-like isoform X2 n=1 Tax=Phalaenopsis equestris TaxID=78828 RepID=UPI0009E20B5A|nr:vacuolar cation/proton exchanger 2-like isoform X2 [Phalaenopsis equestris]
MEYAYCIYKCYFASSNRQCCRTCKRHYVCHERKTSKFYDSAEFLNFLTGFVQESYFFHLLTKDISLGVAIGSSTQISMFGIPFCVIIGWIMERHMDLNFQLFETVTLFITVLVVAFMLQDGTSNYLRGMMLILSYIIVAASFYVHVDPTFEESSPMN